MDASPPPPLPTLTTKDPLALLLVGQQMMADLILDMDEVEWTSNLLDAAAFGDTGNLQRYAQRLDETFFLFDESSSDHQTACRRFFVACVLTLAVLQDQKRTLYAFPGTWWDGELVSQKEFELLTPSLSPGALTLADSFRGLTIQGWVAINGSAGTIRTLDTERNGVYHPTSGGGRESPCALHAGLLWNSNPEAVDLMLDIWGRSLGTYKGARERTKIFSELGGHTHTNPVLDRLLERWIEVCAPGLHGTPEERQQAGQELLNNPAAWTAGWNAAATHAAATLYERVVDLAWPGYPKTDHATGPALKNLFQALVMGRVEVRELGLEGCARAAERIGHMLGEPGSGTSDSEKLLLGLLGGEIASACQQAGLDAPQTLGRSGGNRRQAMTWLATAQIARRNKPIAPRTKRKM